MIGDAIHFIFNAFNAINIHIATLLYRITGLQDTTILIIATLFITVYPITRLFLNFTNNFSTIKMVLIILTMSMIFTSGVKIDEELSFLQNLSNHLETTATVSLVLTLIFGVMAIMEDPYYDGLFGRFRDE